MPRAEDGGMEIAMKKIVLTGGGTAGHVTPNIALIPSLREAGYEIYYIGSIDGIEKKLIADYDIPYTAISTGKFRRYFDLKNLTDPFRVIKGVRDAHKALKKIKPDIVFSKGGFVSVPVVHAAHSLKIPVICHESDMTPGLANKLCIPFAEKICCNFPETVDNLPAEKAVLTGTPIRSALLSGDRNKALEFTKLPDDKPFLLVMGGSLGAQAVNEAVRADLPQLLKEFNVIHLCGKGKVDTSCADLSGYVQYEYIKDELPDLFALTDVVISRAGANAICELLALKKPALLIPLSAKASRGDQILNARSFEKQGFSVVLEEEEITPELLMKTVSELYRSRDTYIRAMAENKATDAIRVIMELIEDRHARKSTIITSQLPVKNWYDILAKNTTVADAVLDRLAEELRSVGVPRIPPDLSQSSAEYIPPVLVLRALGMHRLQRPGQGGNRSFLAKEGHPEIILAAEQLHGIDDRFVSDQERNPQPCHVK